jgi:hypothetical protein
VNSLLFSAAARQPHGRSQRGRSKRGELIAWVACFRLPAIALQTWLFSTNCDAAVSLKAKTSRSNIAHMGNTSI